MALTTAVATGAVAAVVLPWVAEREDEGVATLMGSELVHIPIGGGFELHWSWLVFCVVTLIAWGSLAAARSK